MKKTLSIIAGSLVGSLLLWLALRHIDFGRLAAAYAGMRKIYLLPSALLVVAELFLRGARWRLLLRPSSPSARVADAFRLETAGLALNNILPLRLGELARATFGARVFGAPLVTVLATILVERLLDVVVLFLLFALAARLGGLTGGMLAYGGALWTLAAGAAAGIAALIFSDELVAHAWFSGFFRRFPRFRALFERVAMGVKGFHSLRSGALIIGFAAAQWIVDALNMYLLGLAFGLGAAIDLFKGMALIFAGAAAASMPGMPGYFGNYELVLTRVLGAWGVPADAGFAYVFCAHVTGYLIVTLLGLFFIYRMGHSLEKVWAEFSAVRKERA